MLYYDVFNYPLTVSELYANSPVRLSREIFDEELDRLIERGLLRKQDGFILSSRAVDSDIQKRKNGNAGAKHIMPTALRYAQRIAGFPFVEGLCLSGSLSKNYFDAGSDVDFFIITKPGRLWLCRTLLILRYKLLPQHKRKFWCVNYFISSDSLAIPDVNVFTATELAHLIPVTNYELYLKLLDKNSWYRTKFPNKKIAPAEFCFESRPPAIKTWTESVLNGSFGKWLDNRLLNLTLSRWRRKFSTMTEEDFELQFRSRKDACKRHVKGFQNKVLLKWHCKAKEFENKYTINLEPG